MMGKTPEKMKHWEIKTIFMLRDLPTCSLEIKNSLVDEKSNRLLFAARSLVVLP